MAEQKHIKVLYSSPVFTIEQKEISFKNGEKRLYEVATKAHSVMIIALDSLNQILCVREYCAGINEYAIGLPKGRIEQGQSPEEAAQRELQEETGYRAQHMHYLGVITLSPGYSTQKSHIFLALNLTEDPLPGDEPEKLTIERYTFSQAERLIDSGTINEARVIATISKARRYIENESNSSVTHRDTVFI